MTATQEYPPPTAASGAEVQDPRVDVAGVREVFTRWLSRQKLAARSRDTYVERADAYLAWLADLDEAAHAELGDPLTDTLSRDFAVRDWRAYLLTVRRRSPHYVNTALAAVDALYSALGMGPADAPRVDLPQRRPQGVAEAEQRRLLRATERRTARDRALVGLGYHAGLRPAELAALDVDDVPLTARTGAVIVRAGKGSRYREVPLAADGRRVLEPSQAPPRSGQSLLHDVLGLFEGPEHPVALCSQLVPQRRDQIREGILVTCSSSREQVGRRPRG